MDKKLGFLIIPASVLVFPGCQRIQSPNVLLIITDDQGYGDLSFTGNPSPWYAKYRQTGWWKPQIQVISMCVPFQRLPVHR